MGLVLKVTPKTRLSGSKQLPQRYHLEAALTQVTDAVVTADAANELTYLNPAAEALTGWSLGEAQGKSLRQVLSIFHGDEEVAIESAIDAVKFDESVGQVARHAVLVGKTRRPAVIEYSVAAIRDADQNFTGTVIVFRDITRRRVDELARQASEESSLASAEALFEEKERAQVTLNSIGDAVISIDFRGRVSFLNAVAEKMTGWSQTEAEGRLPDEVFFVVDAVTRQQVPSPTMQAIIEDRTVRLDAPCILIRRDGSEIAVEDSASPIHDQNGGVIGAVMVAHDVTAARDLSDRLAHLALHDNLTELPNRALFCDRLDQALVRAQRNSTSAAVVFVDLDRFKPVNDTLGHAVGDQLLQAVARRLLGCVRGSDTVSRYGGDEFLILLNDVSHPQDAAMCADKINTAFAKAFEVAGHTLHISASIGIARFPEDATDGATLLKLADAAMYQAKHRGRNTFQFYSADVAPGDR